MGLVEYKNIEDGTLATANSVNSRFAGVLEQVNGKIDSANLKDGAITREKIANNAITSDKMFVKTYVDANGWTVYDYGNHREYRLQRRGTISYGKRQGDMLPGIPFPVGVKHLNDVFLNWSARQHSRETIFSVFLGNNNDWADKVYLQAFNTADVAIKNHPYIVDLIIKEK